MKFPGNGVPVLCRSDPNTGLITKGTNASPWSLQLAGNGALRFSANCGAPSGAVGSGFRDSAARLTTGAWHHVAATYDGARLRFYLDGVLDANSPVTHLRFGLANEPIVLGADFAGGDEYFRGTMRDARVYGGTLPRSEIIGLASPVLVPVGATWKYFDQTNDLGTAWRATNYNDSAWRIVDLDAYPLPAGAESRQVEVTASFHGADSSRAERHQIRLATFAEPPGEVKAVWNGTNMFDQVLQHVGRTVKTKPGVHGWQTLRATMEIPPGARSLVISLAATITDESAPKASHYLDDVHATFVIKEANP